MILAGFSIGVGVGMAILILAKHLTRDARV